MKRGYQMLLLVWGAVSTVGLSKIESGPGGPLVARPSRLQFEVGARAEDCGVWRKVTEKTRRRRLEIAQRFDLALRLAESAKEAIAICAREKGIEIPSGDDAMLAESCDLEYGTWLEIGTKLQSLEEESNELEREELQLIDLIGANCSRRPTGVVLSSITSPEEKTSK